MKFQVALASTLPGLLVAAMAATAGADGTDSTSPAATTTATVPTAVTVAVPSCRLSDHTGISDADALTAGRLVCAEIDRADGSSGARYRVSLGTLGSLVILSVAREGEALGSTADSREMTLHGVEEVAVAAPRIAQSIVRGTSLAKTETVDNLVGQETREPKTKPGKVHFAIGLLGVFGPFSQGAGVAPGGLLDVHYEMSQVEFGGSLRFGGGSSSNSSPSVAFFEAALGGRLFLTDKDVSPYAGAGLSWSYFHLDLPQGAFDGGNSGLGAYGEAGIEVLRTHHAHLALGARIELPFYALNGGPNNYYQLAGGAPAAPPAAQTFYYAPLSLEARLTF